MKKVLLTLLVLALTIGTVSFAALGAAPKAGDSDGAPGFGPGMGRGFAKKLQLTADQEQKLLAIRQEFQKDTQSIRFDLEKKQLELGQLWGQNPLSQTALENKQKEITGLRVQLVTKQRAMLEKLKAVLTPEQLKKMEGFRAKAEQRMGKGGKQRRGGCGGYDVRA